MLSLEIGKGGSLLNLRLLGDDALSIIDSAVASPHSVTQFAPLSIKSDVLPVLNTITAALPKSETRDPGGLRKVNGSAADLSNPVALLGGVTSALPAVVPPGLISGKLAPFGLSSLLEGGTATSTLDSELVDLGVLFNALKVKSITNTLGAKAAAPNSEGTRGLKIGVVTVLSLGELLEGLTMKLADLPVPTISKLVKDLNLLVDLPTGETSVSSAVATLDKAIADVKKAVAAAPAPASTTLGTVVNDVPTVKSIVIGLPEVLPVSSVTDVPVTMLLTQTVSTTLDTLQTTLTNLLKEVLGRVGGTPLLTFDGADITARTLATDSVATSAAEVVADLGGVTVLNTSLPGVNLAGVGATLSGITDTLGNTLSTISPLLKDLVGVDLLKKTTSVSTSGGYVRSAASFDVLKVSITPPAGIADLVKSLTGGSASASSSTGVLRAAGIANPASVLPVQGASMTSLAGLLNLPAGVGALLEGLTLRVGSVQSNSDHIVAASVSAPAVLAPAPATPVSPPGQQLPRTGSESTQMAILAIGLATFALGLRRFVLRPAKG